MIKVLIFGAVIAFDSDDKTGPEPLPTPRYPTLDELLARAYCEEYASRSEETRKENDGKIFTRKR